MLLLLGLVSRSVGEMFVKSVWCHWLLAFAAGALAVLSLAPFDFAPILLCSFTVLVLLMDSAMGRWLGTAARGVGGQEDTHQRWRRWQWLPTRLRQRGSFIRSSAAVGWWFGVGYFAFGVYWIGVSFLTKGLSPVLMVFAITALVMALAIPIALALAGAAIWWDRQPSRVLVLAVLWMLGEQLRALVFPWNNIGMALLADINLAQSLSVIGVNGGSGFVVWLSCIPAVWLAAARYGEFTKKSKLIITILAVLPLGAGYTFGVLRLADAGHVAMAEAGKWVRVVQPNVRQQEKWEPATRARTARTLAEYTVAPITPAAHIGGAKPADDGGVAAGAQYPSIVVWPEVALPLVLTAQSRLLEQLAGLLKEGQVLVMGALWREDKAGGSLVYNSVISVNERGVGAERYDKNTLVPFGEYTPFASVLSKLGIGYFTQNVGAFAAGESLAPMALGAGLPTVSIAICYEIMLPRDHRRLSAAAPSPDAIITVTNDAWFGNTIGPHQHFSLARARALEAGLPVIRAANTGISGVIDSYGRVISHLELNVAGSLDVQLPTPRPQSLYNFAHGLWAWLTMLLLVAVRVILIRTNL